MILTTYDKDLYEKTLKEDAREEGRAEGREEGMEYLNQLNKYLLKSKRYSDLERATEDIEYQKNHGSAERYLAGQRYLGGRAARAAFPQCP